MFIRIRNGDTSTFGQWSVEHCFEHWTSGYQYYFMRLHFHLILSNFECDIRCNICFQHVTQGFTQREVRWKSLFWYCHLWREKKKSDLCHGTNTLPKDSLREILDGNRFSGIAICEERTKKKRSDLCHGTNTLPKDSLREMLDGNRFSGIAICEERTKKKKSDPGHDTNTLPKDLLRERLDGNRFCGIAICEEQMENIWSRPWHQHVTQWFTQRAVRWKSLLWYCHLWREKKKKSDPGHGTNTLPNDLLRERLDGNRFCGIAICEEKKRRNLIQVMAPTRYPRIYSERG